MGRMRYRPVGSEDDSRLSARVWYGRPPSSGANVTRASRGSTRSRATAQPRTGSTGDAHWPAVGAVSTVPWGARCGRCSAYRGSPRATRPSPRGGCPPRANANQAIDEIPLCRIVGEQRHLPGARLWASRPGWHCVDGRQGTVHRRSSLSPGIAGGRAAGAVAFRTPTGGSGGRGRQVPSAPQPPPNSELVDLHGEHGEHGPKRTVAGVLARNAGRGASQGEGCSRGARGRGKRCQRIDDPLGAGEPLGGHLGQQASHQSSPSKGRVSVAARKRVTPSEYRARRPSRATKAAPSTWRRRGRTRDGEATDGPRWRPPGGNASRRARVWRTRGGGP